MDTPTQKCSGCKAQKSKGTKIVETSFLVVTWIALGLYLEIFGPTLIDLKQRFNTGYEGITVAISARSVGMFPGSVCGGILVDKFVKYSHLLLAICLNIAAIATATIPWLPSVMMLWVLCFVGGFVESIITIAGQRLVLRLWYDKAATPMILLHSGYGLGSFIVTMYATPFLAKRPDHRKNLTCPYGEMELNSTWRPLNQSNGSTNKTDMACFIESSIQYPFVITAALLALHSVSFFIFQIRERNYEHCYDRNTESGKTKSEKPSPKNGRTFVDMINPASCTGGRFWYGVQIFILVFLFAGNASGGERVIAGFLRTFAVESLNFSSNNASYINTSFWISFSVGRISFSILAKWMKINHLLFLQTFGLLVVTSLMSFLIELYPFAYWILVQPLGIFLAPVWPTCYAWTDHHLELTGIGMSLIILGGSVGGISHLRLLGYLYKRAGTYAFIYQILGFGILSFIIAVLLIVVGTQHGSRFDLKTYEIKIHTKIENIQKEETTKM